MKSNRELLASKEQAIEPKEQNITLAATNRTNRTGQMQEQWDSEEKTTAELLELRFQWQGATLEVAHFAAPRMITAGPHPLNDININCDAFGDGNYPLIVPLPGERFGLFLTDAFMGKMIDEDGEVKHLTELAYSRQHEQIRGYRGFVLPVESGQQYALKLEDFEISAALVTPEKEENSGKLRQWDHLFWRITSFSAIAHLALILMFQFVPNGNASMSLINLNDKMGNMIVVPPPVRRTKPKFNLKEPVKRPAPRVSPNTNRVKGEGPAKNPGKKVVRNVKNSGLLGLMQSQMGSSGMGNVFGRIQKNWLPGKVLGTRGASAMGFGFGTGRCIGANCSGGDGGGGSLYGGGGRWGNNGKRKYRRGRIVSMARRAKKGTVKIKPGMLTFAGSLSKGEIGRVVRQNWFMIQHCYESQLRKYPNLAGKITLKWVIAGTGRVQTINVLQSTMNNERVENCLRRRISRWRFPQPRGGGMVFVKYPFLFFNAGK